MSATCESNGVTGQVKVFSRKNGELLLNVVIPADDNFVSLSNKIITGIHYSEKVGYLEAGKDIKKSLLVMAETL